MKQPQAKDEHGQDDEGRAPASAESREIALGQTRASRHLGNSTRARMRHFEQLEENK